MPLSSPSLLLAMLVAAPAQDTAPATPAAAAPVQDAALAAHILDLFRQDQVLLADLEKAKKADPAFPQAFKAYRARIQAEQHLYNFGDPALYRLWAAQSDAPDIVRRAVAFRTQMDAQVRDIVAQHGWPRRATVGDEAAASFFFLFGHGDDDNQWRRTQIATIDSVFRTDHLNPRLYAHMRDRLEDVAGKPQIFGTIMGPGPTPGTAKLYWPLSGDEAAADRRRAAIGLPSIAQDLDTFRGGADIGPYMRPLKPGQGWTIADAYGAP